MNMSLRKSKSSLYLLMMSSFGCTLAMVEFLEQLGAGIVRITLPFLVVATAEDGSPLGDSDILVAMVWSR